MVDFNFFIGEMYYISSYEYDSKIVLEKIFLRKERINSLQEKVK